MKTSRSLWMVAVLAAAVAQGQVDPNKTMVVVNGASAPLGTISIAYS